MVYNIGHLKTFIYIFQLQSLFFGLKYHEMYIHAVYVFRIDKALVYRANHIL